MPVNYTFFFITSNDSEIKFLAHLWRTTIHSIYMNIVHFLSGIQCLKNVYSTPYGGRPWEFPRNYWMSRLLVNQPPLLPFFLHISLSLHIALGLCCHSGSYVSNSSYSYLKAKGVKAKYILLVVHSVYWFEDRLHAATLYSKRDCNFIP